ncbi:MAG: c-type cytochrome [Reyranella sp.]
MWFDRSAFAVLLAASLGVADAAAQSPRYGIGRQPTPAEISAWDIDVRADGKGLPKGSGTVGQGKEIFTQRCAACHGADGRGAQAEALVGGRGTLASPNPVRTIGSYWPYATTIFDFVRRAMPFDTPQSLGNDEVYAVTAYLLHLNGVVGNGATLDASSLPAIVMPNRNGFTADPRPDVGTQER